MVNHLLQMKLYIINRYQFLKQQKIKDLEKTKINKIVQINKISSRHKELIEIITINMCSLVAFFLIFKLNFNILKSQKYFMFNFSCCKESKPQYVYEIHTKHSVQHQEIKVYRNIDDANLTAQTEKNTRIIRAKPSDYQYLLKNQLNNNEKFTDQQFPPNQTSFGKIQDIIYYGWKRISQIIPDPVLFNNYICPMDVIQGNIGDCYFLSAISALAQNENYIKDIFYSHKYSPQGIYRVKLRLDGSIKQIVVDDYVPINKNQTALFCRPNLNQFWVMILEKAWAKAHGSYANIISGSPSEVFKAFTFAPSQTIKLINDQQKLRQVWQKLRNSVLGDYPCCCGTITSKQVPWGRLGLVQEHAYTIIDVAQLQDVDGDQFKMIKLRNPYGKTQWKGQGNEQDRSFWQSIKDTRQKRAFIKDMKNSNDGIFYMAFRDFSKYFDKLYISYVQENGNYVSENMNTQLNNGSMYKLRVYRKGKYNVTLHQESLRGQSEQIKADGLCRATVIIAKKDRINRSFQLVDGLLKYNEQDSCLKLQLESGAYYIYAKLQPTLNLHRKSKQAAISIYSQQYASLSALQIIRYKNFLQQLFLQDALVRQKKNYYCNKKVWVTWRLLFLKGGYAYLVFGVQSDSSQKLIVHFNESDFNRAHFKLKKPFKGKGENQVINIMPGDQKILIARVLNENITTLQFPPMFKLEAAKL